jgi:hypothetical protein
MAISNLFVLPATVIICTLAILTFCNKDDIVEPDINTKEWYFSPQYL